MTVALATGPTALTFLGSDDAHFLRDHGDRTACGSSAAGAFTLIELLVVIMIMGILASIATVAVMDAQQEARRARTRVQIQKIHELLMLRWESYRTRPVPVRTSRVAPELAARVRLNAVRELMRMEMPDRITDVLFSGEQQANYTLDFSVFAVQPQSPNVSPGSLINYPSQFLAYRRRIATAGQWTPQHQQAECLYMILASIQDGTSNGLEHFRDNELGDTDGDGMPEILDGWNRPIRFLRGRRGLPRRCKTSPT